MASMTLQKTHSSGTVSISPYFATRKRRQSPRTKRERTSRFFASHRRCLYYELHEEILEMARQVYEIQVKQCPLLRTENSEDSAANEKIFHASRHLCAHACYRKIHAPFRLWSEHCLSHRLKDDKSSEGEWILFCNSRGETRILRANVKTIDSTTNENDWPESSSFPRNLFFCNYSSDRALSCDSNPPRLRLALSVPPAYVSPTSTTDTPVGLLEELFVNDPWKLLLSAIVLQRTTRRQVDVVLYRFLGQWPTLQDVLQLGPDDLDDMRRTLQPLGMNYRRASGIYRFSREYWELLQSKRGDTDQAARQLSRAEVLSLYYCGEYSYAAYQIFIQQDLNVVTDDNALEAYMDYQRCYKSRLSCNFGRA